MSEIGGYCQPGSADAASSGEIEFFQSISEGVARQSDQPGGLAFIISGLFKCGHDQLALDVLKRNSAWWKGELLGAI